MTTNLSPAERAAWNAIGHSQPHWGAVQRALTAARPVIERELAQRLATALDGREHDAAAAHVRYITGIDPLRHGRYSTYNHHGCRCALCTLARRDYERAARARRKAAIETEGATQ